MTYRIFIDGAAGTTGLQVNERLAAHPSVTPVTLDDAQRKDAAAPVSYTHLTLPTIVGV